MLSSIVSGEILYGTEGYGNIFFVIGAFGIAWNILFVIFINSRYIHLNLSRFSSVDFSISPYRIVQRSIA